MKPSLIKFICCHKCHKPFSIDIIKEDSKGICEGLLVCAGCNEIYPVVDYIPRIFDKAIFKFPHFISKNKNAIGKYSIKEKNEDKTDELFKKQLPGMLSFSTQWSSLDYDCDNIWGWTLEEQTNYYLQELDCEVNDFKGKIILDAGCGHGKIANWFAGMGAEVIGLDLSNSIERADMHKTSPNCSFIQGSVMTPPLLPGKFDIVFSSGVIHHTPNTYKSFRSLCELVKSEGKLCIWVYHPTLLKKFLMDPIRLLLSRLPRKAQDMFLFAFYVPYVLREKIKYKKKSRTFSERYIVLRDQLCPRYAFHHVPEEVISWYEGMKFTNIKKTTEIANGFSVIGNAP